MKKLMMQMLTPHNIELNNSVKGTNLANKVKDDHNNDGNM